MERIQHSDHVAYKLLYNRLWETCYRKAYALVGDKAVAQDIAQDIWISLWERRETIQNDHIEGYLANAVRYKAYNEFRSVKHRQSLINEFNQQALEIPKTNPTDDLINLKTTRKRIDAIIETLPKKCRKVFIMSRYEGLRNEEIAQKLNISKRTVETHISNALKALRDKLPVGLLILLGMF